jgi:hypothetical protein
MSTGTPGLRLPPRPSQRGENLTVSQNGLDACHAPPKVLTPATIGGKYRDCGVGSRPCFEPLLANHEYIKQLTSYPPRRFHSNAPNIALSQPKIVFHFSLGVPLAGLYKLAKPKRGKSTMEWAWNKVLACMS